MQSNTARVKTKDLWGKGKDDLKKQLDDLKGELGSLRVQKIAGGGSSKLTRMYAEPENTLSPTFNRSTKTQIEEMKNKH